MKQALMRPKFSLGRIVVTPAALDAIQGGGQSPDSFLDKHVQSDWGTACREDRQASDDAHPLGTRLLSAYKTLTGCWIWIVTEADRSLTTIMLPSEFRRQFQFRRSSGPRII
jgi:hypothetical protein